MPDSTLPTPSDPEPHPLDDGVWIVLPDLTTALNRRAAIFGALAIGTGAAAGEIAALARPALLKPFDARFVEMQRKAMALKAYSDHPDTDGELGDDAYTEASHLQHEAIEMSVSTPGGALASLLWARDEFAQHYVDEAHNPDWMDRFTLRMIDNAIAVLRAEVEATVVPA